MSGDSDSVLESQNLINLFGNVLWYRSELMIVGANVTLRADVSSRTPTTISLRDFHEQEAHAGGDVGDSAFLSSRGFIFT